MRPTGLKVTRKSLLLPNNLVRFVQLGNADSECRLTSNKTYKMNKEIEELGHIIQSIPSFHDLVSNYELLRWWAL